MNRRNHLTDQQVEQYASLNSSPTIDQRLIERHITTCERCRARVLEYEREHLGVLEDGPGSETRTPNCPEDDVLQKFAAGVCSPETAEEVMEHVADCRYCAPLLKDYLEALQEAAPAHWSQRFFSRFEFFSRVPVPSKVAWAGGLAVVAVTCIVALPPVVNVYKLHRAQSILAAAFQESRPNVMRVVWGPYAEVDVRRSPKKVIPISELPTLAEAARIAGKERYSSDPRWIRFHGRVKLLANEEDAPALLAIAAEKGLNDPSTEIDLAVAYFQKESQAAGNDVNAQTSPNLDQSLELLNKVLREPKLSEEQKKVALFDLAIVYEKMLFRDQAVAIWERYLALDQAGPWHEEAQRRLEKVKSNPAPAKPQGYREPGFFLRNLDDPAVQASLEDYQDIALRAWGGDATKDPNSEASHAIFALGKLLEERHGDLWMNDFLRALKPGDLPGVQALGAAITSNKQGQSAEARRHAQEAADRFVQSRNYPGLLRARFEGIYANQRLLEGGKCLVPAQTLADQLLGTRYRWLQAQTALEQAVCLNFTIDFGAALKKLGVGRRIAADANFNLLGLRARALEAGIWVSHDCNMTWQQVQSGLEQYWPGPGFPLRLYEFYSVEKQCLEKNQLWYAAEALERRMITILENDVDRNDENVLLEFTAHSALGQILRELNDDGAAEDQARLAILLLNRVDQTIAAKYQVPINLELADLQVDHGDTEAALATEQEAEKQLIHTHNPLMRLEVLRVRGDIHLERRQIKEAEDDYEAALVIAERGLRPLATESDRRQWIKEKGDVYRGLVEVFLEQQRDQEALQLWEWYQARSFVRDTGFAEDTVKSQWVDIEQTVLNQPLPSISATRLVYASTRNHLHIWRIGSAGIKTVSVPEKRNDLQRKIVQYLQKCGTPQNPDLPLPAPDEESRKLFALLLQPVIADLQGSDVVVIDLDKVMTGLPIEALKSPEGWYFGEKYPVIYSPGYIRENDLRNPSQQTLRTGVLLDAWDAESEHNKLIELFPQLKVVYDEAVSAAELPASLESSEMFIFIGHGKSGSLILHNGRPLQAEDFPLESLQRLQLVVLAGCSTGSNPGLLATGNLVDAFQSGRTPNVIASQWDVRSATTTELMTSFYTHLKNGDSVPHALFEARKEILRKYGHPYFWAAFVLNGRAG